MRSMVHITTQAKPMQLVFGRDAMINLKFDANWNLIKQQKQRLIGKKNEMEKRKGVPYMYKVHNLVLVKNQNLANLGKTPITVRGP